MRVNLTESDSAAIASTPVASLQPISADNIRTYPISPEGRRQASVLLVGVASLWVFAVWSLINLFDGGLSGIEWVSALLMLGIVLVAPVVAWALLEEANSRITTGTTGLRYTSIGGIDLLYPWQELSSFQPKDRKGKVARFFLGDDDKEGARDAHVDTFTDEDNAEPDTRLLNTTDHTADIKNTFARAMHKLSHGASLPIYGGLQDRDALLAEIASQTKSEGV